MNVNKCKPSSAISMHTDRLGARPSEDNYEQLTRKGRQDENPSTLKQIGILHWMSFNISQEI